MTLPIRTLTTDDLTGVWAVLEHAFAGPHASDEDRDVEFALADPARFYGGYDGDHPVASGGSLALSMTVPGGSRPVAGVTWIGVQPTHRRRGLLTSIMGRLIGDLHDRGEAVAALWASEGAIYQRFGFGPAAWDVALAVPSHAAFNRPVAATGLRLVEPDRTDLRAVYDSVAATTGGWHARDDAWWDYRLHDPEGNRSGASPLRCVLADGPTGVEGYALYATRQEWESGRPSGTAHLRELVAVNPEAKARLWRYLLDLDLLQSVRSHITGADEPLLQLLAEPRAAVPRLKDNLWVRLVDVAAALGGRAYAADVDLVLAVEDDACPWNAGRFRLQAGRDGATCESTSEEPDLRVHAADLGAAYLGGTTLLSRAAAGHVTELRDGALVEASAAFSWPGPAPYAPLAW